MSFDETDETFDRVDFGILRDGGVRRCIGRRWLDSDLQWLTNAGYPVERFDLPCGPPPKTWKGPSTPS